MRRTSISIILFNFVIACSATVPGASSSGAPVQQGVTPNTGLTQVEPQDVSTIYPLPAAKSEFESMVRGGAVGTFGELIPSEAFSKLDGPLDERSLSGVAGKTGDEARTQLRLVGLRVDPCFGLAGAPSCPNQLRLIFQGVQFESEATVADGAVHVFYELPHEGLVRFVKQVLTLREQSGDFEKAKLGVHPILQKQGLSGEFATGLKNVILEHTGSSRVTRMTFFRRTNARQGTWVFGLLNKAGATYERGAIFSLTAPRNQKQTFTNESFGDNLQATPIETTHPDNLSLLLNTASAKSASEADRQKAFDAALRIENPVHHSPDTIDCVSCHVATTASESAATRFLLKDVNKVGFEPKPVFAGPEKRTLDNLHAMSYLGRELGITQRTANETALVVQAVIALLK
jgi:hypothetical protein